MNTVLITGGSGFLGINLVRNLRARGVEHIRILDIADFDYPEKNESWIEFTKGDVRDLKTVETCADGCDLVVNTAAALPLYPPEDIRTTEVDGARNCIAACRAKGVKRMIQISSTAVYGVPKHHPIYETDQLVGVGPYGHAKIEAEEICRAARAEGFCVPIIRPKSFIGPERLGVFALFYDWAYTGHGFPMIGSGNNRYQLMDVEDLCDAIWLAATLPDETVNTEFNIGTPAIPIPVPDTGISFGIPPLSIIKRVTRTGSCRMTAVISDAKTGKFIDAYRGVQARTFFNHWVMLMFIPYVTRDIEVADTGTMTVEFFAE